MLAVHALSAGTQALVYFFAFIVFLIAGALSVIPTPKIWWNALVAFGLSACAFVLFWNAFALS